MKAEQMTECLGGLGVDVKSAQLSGRANYITGCRKLGEKKIRQGGIQSKNVFFLLLLFAL
jgi:hypothetical protein